MPRVINTTSATIHAGGRAFPPRVPVNLSRRFRLEALQPYLESGRLEAEGLPTAAPATDSSVLSSASTTDPRTEALRRAVEQLDSDDADHWTRDGRPDLNTVNSLLPEGTESFSAAERDDCWARIRAEAEE